VIDEADLILSYGHDEDIRQIFHGGFLPQVFQSFLMSATMTEDVELLKGLTLRNPVRAVQSTHVDMHWQFLKAVLKLEEDEDEAANLSQYAVKSVL
jgi:ATP-dependent RNA helicase DDX56/DBP9